MGMRVETGYFNIVAEEPPDVLGLWAEKWEGNGNQPGEDRWDLFSSP